MGGDYVDVIIFAAIAAFLVFRLLSVLGKRTGQKVHAIHSALRAMLTSRREEKTGETSINTWKK